MLRRVGRGEVEPFVGGDVVLRNALALVVGEAEQILRGGMARTKSLVELNIIWSGAQR
jgi:hypothetical protein